MDVQTLAISISLLAGCALFRAPKPEPVEVAIVSLPSRADNAVAWSCMLEPRPTPPQEQTVNYEDEDVMRRVWVHVRAYNAMVEYQHDLDFWATSVTNCLTELARIHMVGP